MSKHKPTPMRIGYLCSAFLLVISQTTLAVTLFSESAPPALPAIQNSNTTVHSTATWYQPTPNTRWYWQLQGKAQPDQTIEMLDIDLFDSSADTIQTWQKQGSKVICYFSAGTYENWRDDAKQFPDVALGNNLAEWPGEKWLDIRSNALRGIMQARLLLAKHKGCDGVEPDNVDAYTNKSGFPLGKTDQINYNRWLATTAHELGLSIGLKNAPELVNDLVDDFDFNLNEQCHQYQECEQYQPFIRQNKPVFNAEYADEYINSSSARNRLCKTSRVLGINTLVLPLKLDGSFIYRCAD